MNNLHRVTNIFIGDGTAFPANDAAMSALSAGKIGIYGQDLLALNPSGADTVITQPNIYIVESKTDTSGVAYLKRSVKINWENVISYNAAPYAPAQREVWAIGHNRKTAVGTIEVNNSTEYRFSILFKNDKFLYSNKPENFSVSFTSATAATQLSIATQIAAAINNGAFRSLVTAIVVADGTGVYGLTGATDYGVEITGRDINQFTTTSYFPNIVKFSVHVDDAGGFESTTTCTQINACTAGSGTFNQVRAMENLAYGSEGVTNRRLWPIPELDYSSTSTMKLSAATGITAAGTTGEDTVTFGSDISAVIRVGEKVEIDAVNYEVKYAVSTTVLVLTSVLTTTFGASDVAKVRVSYDLVTLEFNDTINGAIGVIGSANKTVILAVPALDTGDAYTGISLGGQDILDILNGWIATGAGDKFADITI